MSPRFRILTIGFLLGGIVVTICVWVSLDRKRVKEDELEANLRKINRIDLIEVRRAKAEERPLPTPTKSPKVAISESTTHDFGRVLPFESVSHKFAIRNEGDAPLILNVESRSCNCTTAALESHEISPGEQGLVEVTFEATSATSNSINHGIVLTTNDPNRKHIRLSLLGEVQRTLWMAPDQLAFSDLTPKESRTGQFHVLSQDAELPVLRDLRSEPELALRIYPASPEVLQQHGAKSGVTVEVDSPSKFPKKIFDMGGQITFSVKRPNEEKDVILGVPWFANRVGVISMVSGEDLNGYGELEIGRIDEGEGHHRTILIKARGKNKLLEFKRCDVKPAFVEVRLERYGQTEKTGLHKLHIVIPPDAPVGSYMGEDAGSIHLQFSDPEYPEVTLAPSFSVSAD